MKTIIVILILFSSSLYAKDVKISCKGYTMSQLDLINGKVFDAGYYEQATVTIYENDAVIQIRGVSFFYTLYNLTYSSDDYFVGEAIVNNENKSEILINRLTGGMTIQNFSPNHKNMETLSTFKYNCIKAEQKF
tara:strand:+ start:1407 stop:1808 length:402 start_codon:yes stop_codon:yes gene_type:complete